MRGWCMRIIAMDGYEIPAITKRDCRTQRITMHDCTIPTYIGCAQMRIHIYYTCMTGVKEDGRPGRCLSPVALVLHE